LLSFKDFLHNSLIKQEIIIEEKPTNQKSKFNQNLPEKKSIWHQPVPEEYTSLALVEDPKLTNSSSDGDPELDLSLSTAPPPSSTSSGRTLAGTLTGGNTNKNFSKSKEPSSLLLSIMSSLRANSASLKPFLRRKSSTASTSGTARPVSASGPAIRESQNI
jgi:hypothetical protein